MDDMLGLVEDIDKAKARIARANARYVSQEEELRLAKERAIDMAAYHARPLMCGYKECGHIYGSFPLRHPGDPKVALQARVLDDLIHRHMERRGHKTRKLAYYGEG